MLRNELCNHVFPHNQRGAKRDVSKSVWRDGVGIFFLTSLLPRSLNSEFTFPSTSAHPRVNRNSLGTGPHRSSNVIDARAGAMDVDWSFLSACAKKKLSRAHGKTAATRRRLSGSRRPRRGFQNGTLLRINRANEAVWLRQERRLYFSPTHRARLSTCPSIHPFRLFMVDRIHRGPAVAGAGTQEEGRRHRGGT